MSNVPFSEQYAELYDAIYADKDYRSEANLVVELARQHGADASELRILDAGCGTGRHTMALAAMGHHVVGVDRSTSMLEAARKRARAASPALASRVRFAQGALGTLATDIQGPFDVALMMFAVLGYVDNDDAAIAALQDLRRLLNPNGVLLFDIWYGPAVLQQRPSQRIKTVPLPAATVFRVAESQLDTAAQVCTVDYRFWHVDIHGVSTGEEQHRMRFYFPRELHLLMRAAGFMLVDWGSFPDFKRPPDETTWNVMCVARPA
jgi:SAM-dependent methyltransferase